VQDPVVLVIPALCKQSYPAGTLLSLKAIPKPGWQLGKWANGQGDCVKFTGTTPQPLTQSTLCGVMFVKAPLTAKDISTLDAQDISRLTAEQIKVLSPDTISAFTAEQVANLSLAAVQSLTPAQIPFFSKTAVTGFSTEQLQQLNEQAKGAFTPEQRINMQPFIVQPLSPMLVSKVASKYPDNLYYLEGVNHEVIYNVYIDWAKHEPEAIQFLTSKGAQTVTTTAATLNRQFNMGQDFGTCGWLKAIAVDKAGDTSREKPAAFTLMSSPAAGISFARTEHSNRFHYTGNLELDILETVVNRGRIPGLIPIFGGHNLAVDFKLPVNMTVTDTGSAKIRWGNNPSVRFSLLPFIQQFLQSLPSVKINGFRLNLIPSVNINGSFQKDSCRWLWSGSLGAAAKSRFSHTTPIYVPVPIVGSIAINVKVFLEMDADGVFTVKAVKPLEFSRGEFGIEPTAGGEVNVGVDVGIAKASVGVWAEGGGQFLWQISTRARLNRAAVAFDAGAQARLYVWLIINKKWKGKVLDCDWNFLLNRGGCGISFRRREPVHLTLMGREYLDYPHYATFRRSQDPQSSDITPLKLSVYPYSEANISSNDDGLYATWIADNPQRNAVNRTMAVFSIWDGQQWREPQAIADDGTADFNPRLLTFAETGTTLVTWEDVKQPLAETDELATMLSNMEISVSHFDAQTQQWTDSQRLTDNRYLDGNPKLAGQSADNVVLTWISNPANALISSVDTPHQLWFARWDGHHWSTPQLATEITVPLVGYDMVYDGQHGYVVLNLDTDQDLTTLADRELFLLTLEGQDHWSALLPLTADAVIDSNPQLGLDAKQQVILTWLKQGEISSAVNFDLDHRVVIHQDSSGYSDNLNNFKLAGATNGQLAILWAEPSLDYPSDLQALFYNPVDNQWGGQKQLTVDPETEGGVSATFYDANTLVALYNRSLTEFNDTDDVATTQTDLFLLKHTITSEDFTPTPAEALLTPADHTEEDATEILSSEPSSAMIDLPELNAVQADTFALDVEGEALETQALLYGGISVDGSEFKQKIDLSAGLEASEPAATVVFKGLILPDPQHDGQTADIFVFGEYTPYSAAGRCPNDSATFYLMRSLPQDYVLWDEPRTPKAIPAFLYQGVTLQEGQQLEYTLFEGAFEAKGCLSVSFGYRVRESGSVVYNHRTAILDNTITATVRTKPIP